MYVKSLSLFTGTINTWKCALTPNSQPHNLQDYFEFLLLRQQNTMIHALLLCFIVVAIQVNELR
jgi:hypothetical protein